MRRLQAAARAAAKQLECRSSHIQNRKCANKNKMINFDHSAQTKESSNLPIDMRDNTAVGGTVDVSCRGERIEDAKRSGNICPEDERNVIGKKLQHNGFFVFVDPNICVSEDAEAFANRYVLA